MENNKIYCVKGFCGNSKTPNLCVAYKTKRSAQKRFDEMVKSLCYEKIILCLQESVFLPEYAIILAEYYRNTVVLAEYYIEAQR